MERYNFRCSILVLLLFNIFLCGLFILTEDAGFAIYAYDNTPYYIGDDLNQIVSTLEDNAVNMNEMKRNPKKSHLLINKDCRKKNNIANNINPEKFVEFSQVVQKI